MKRIATIFLPFALFTTVVFAQTSNQVVLSFEHKAIGVEPLVLDQTVFSIWNNKKVILSRAEFYISEIEILQPDGTVLPLTDRYVLLNANAPTTEFDLGSWPVETAQGLVMHLGVPQSVNHLDPATYPTGHPLALQNPSMHWGWSAGYRFMAIEGKVDNNGDGVPETTFEFHNLGDALYKTIEFTGTKNAENGELELHFILDYSKLFENMAMSGNVIQHGSGAANVAMMNNAASASFLYIVLPVSATPDVASNSLQIQAWPNPAQAETTLHYRLPMAGQVDLQLTNAFGQTVRTFANLPAAGSVRLETSTLPAGIYRYAFYENGTLLARKPLIVQH